MSDVLGTIRHELGHWLVADALGFRVGEISICRPVSGRLLGSATCFPHVRLYGKTRRILKHCENRISVLFAGVVSEIIFDKDQTEDRSTQLLETAGADDYSKIKEIIYLDASIRNISEKKI